MDSARAALGRLTRAEMAQARAAGLDYEAIESPLRVTLQAAAEEDEPLAALDPLAAVLLGVTFWVLKRRDT